MKRIPTTPTQRPAPMFVTSEHVTSALKGQLILGTPQIMAKLYLVRERNSRNYFFVVALPDARIAMESRSTRSQTNERISWHRGFWKGI